MIANSERVEVLVRGTGAPGSRTVLETLPYDRYMPQTRPFDWDQPRELLTLQYTDAPPVTAEAVPETLRPIPYLDPADASATREIVMAQGMINNRALRHGSCGCRGTLSERRRSGRSRTSWVWTIPFHLHGFQFQILDRNGVPEPFRSWKDTVNVPKHEETVRLIVRFAENIPGSG